MPANKRELPRFMQRQAPALAHRSFPIQPNTFDEADNSVEAIFGTENPVRTFIFTGFDWIEALEVLVMDEQACNLQRFTDGRGSVLDTHQATELRHVLGFVSKASFEEKQLVGRTKFSPRQSIKEIVDDVKGGFIRNLSLGYRVYEYEIVDQEGGLPIFYARKWEPVEVSYVPVGADQGAGTRAADLSSPGELVKPFKEKNMTVNKQNSGTGARAARADGVSAADGTQQQNEIVVDNNGNAVTVGEGGDEVTVNEDGFLVVAGSQADPSADGGTGSSDNGDSGATRAALETSIRAALEQDRQRAAGIRSAAQAFNLNDDQAVELMVKKGVSVERARGLIQEMLAVRQRSNGVSPMIRMGRSSEDPKIVLDNMVEAVAARGLNKRDVGEQARPFMRMSLQDLGRTLLELDGQRVAGDRTELVNQLVRHRSMSTSDLPTLLQAAGNRILMDTYGETATTYQSIAGRQDFIDFRANSMITASSFPDLKEIGESGEITDGVLSESTEKMTGKTYGRVLRVSRQMLINDDLGLFVRLPAMIGRRTAMKHNKIVIDILFGKNRLGATMSDGKSLFHANHGNLAASAAPFDNAAITLGETAVRGQTEQPGGKGDNLGLVPTILLAAGNLARQARVLTADITAAKAEDINFAGQLKPFVDNNVPADRWALLCDPLIAPAVVYGFLQGRDGPQMQEFTEAKTDGFAWQVLDDFAAAPVDFRPAYQGFVS